MSACGECCNTGTGSPSKLEAESEVDRSVDASTKVHLVNIHGWRGYNNPWMLEEETDSEYSYINLLANPERYTGYKVSAKPLKVLSVVRNRQPLWFCGCRGDLSMHSPGLLRRWRA